MVESFKSKLKKLERVTNHNRLLSATNLETPETSILRDKFENEPEQIYTAIEMIEKVKESIDLLDPVSRKVIVLYYGIGCEAMTYREIAKEINVSFVTTRRIQIRALNMLKKRHPWLKGYLGD